MAVGGEFYTDSGILQVTAEYKNLQLVSKGNITLKQQTNNYSASVDTGEGKIIAFRIPAGRSVDTLPYKEGSWFYHPFDGLGDLLVTYYIFDFANIPPGRYFEVKNENEEVCFSDTAKFMKVLSSGSGVVSDGHSFAWPGSSEEWVFGEYATTSPDNVAVVVGKAPTRTDVVSDDDETGTGGSRVNINYFGPAVDFSSTGIKLSVDGDHLLYSYYLGDMSIPTRNYIQGRYNYLILDVTNL